MKAKKSMRHSDDPYCEDCVLLQIPSRFFIWRWFEAGDPMVLIGTPWA